MAGGLWSQHFGQLPPDWGDFHIGAADDGSKTAVLSAAMQRGTKLDVRYRYLNGGLDPSGNWWAWGPSGNGSLVTSFLATNQALGLRACWVIYLLQEEGGADALLSTAANAAAMREYFRELRWVAEQGNGKKAVFVLEPDTWGYLLQKKAAGDSVRYHEKTVPARVNDLGPGYEYLAGLPNNLVGLVRGILRTIRTYAPDARVGLHANYWAVWANGKVSGIPAPDGDKGMVYWDSLDVRYSAEVNARFYRSLTGTDVDPSGDRGDFIVVEIYGLDAGASLPNRWNYWEEKHFRKYLYWVKTLAQGVNLPALGWQIPIGHIGLPNTPGRYEDVYLEYFLGHVRDFIEAGFIGLYLGPGVSQSTQFALDPGAGDDGWALSHLRTDFDSGRPYFTPMALRPGRAFRGISILPLRGMQRDVLGRRTLTE
jgi:hypothetical protein